MYPCPSCPVLPRIAMGQLAVSRRPTSARQSSFLRSQGILKDAHQVD
jgi:hypothetical protein